MSGMKSQSPKCSTALRKTWKKIKAFRDDIGRGRASRRDVFTYNAYLAAHRNGGSLGR
jgi:hypothetical protein